MSDYPAGSSFPDDDMAKVIQALTARYSEHPDLRVGTHYMMGDGAIQTWQLDHASVEVIGCFITERPNGFFAIPTKIYECEVVIKDGDKISIVPEIPYGVMVQEDYWF